jgi:hypothetical protein
MFVNCNCFVLKVSLYQKSMPANNVGKSQIDPAAILLQQQLAGIGTPSSAPPGTYTGGPIGGAPVQPLGVVEAGKIRPPEFQLFKEADHNNLLLAGLNELRNENFLCDVTLMADDKPFQAHRAVLAATSPYLKTLFSDMSGGKIEHEVVEIRGVSSEGLKHIINYIYTSELRVVVAHNIFLNQNFFLLVPYFIF